jgi:threonine/homoserine/homoserine lactone efflux protein
MFIYFLQGATLGMSASVSPGPFQAYLLAQTLNYGWRRTLPITLAPLLSDIPIVTFILLVLTQTPDWFISVLQVLGGLFLLYLAWGTYTSLRAALTPAENLPAEPLRRSFLKGMLMNALSPGPYVFWSVLAGPIVVDAWRQSAAAAVSFVAGFYCLLIGGFMLFVLLFATAGRLGPRVSFWLRAVSVVALLLFGLYQLGVGGSSLAGYWPG